MPRASRYLRDGFTYHLTHRCHDRRFLLRFSRDRDNYRKWLRTAVQRYNVPVYNYCVTSNHTHIIADADKSEDIGSMMQLVSSAYAQQLNRRKAHEGSVWEHPYQCTIIENGRHLLNCLRYVYLNMVRARVVEHPEQWRWSGHDEITGVRSRYRILDIDRLLQSLNIDSESEFKRIYMEGITDALNRLDYQREPAWTESLAVGSQGFLDYVTNTFMQRREFQYSKFSSGESKSAYCVKERRNP